MSSTPSLLYSVSCIILSSECPADFSLAVRVIYAVVVIIKLYIAATGPGDIASIIKRDELHIEQYLERLQSLFQTIMDKDKLSPHSKFLWVIQRLVERYHGIKGRTSKSTGLHTPLLSCADVKTAPKSQAADQAPGLQMLSQVATSNDPDQNGDPRNQGQQQAQPQQGQQGWYPPQQQQQQHMANLPMDPAAYAYQGGPGLPGYDGFDYGIGSLGMGMDGAISGLFMADGLWNFNDAQAQGQQQLFPGWS
jgi:hypothetical protein